MPWCQGYVSHMWMLGTPSFHCQIFKYFSWNKVYWKSSHVCMNWLKFYTVVLIDIWNLYRQLVQNHMLKTLIHCSSFLARLFFFKIWVIAIVWSSFPCLLLSKNFNIDQNFFVYWCIVFILSHNNTCDKTFMRTILNLTFTP